MGLRSLALIGLLGSCSGCAHPSSGQALDPNSTAIENVHLIAMDSERILSGQTILVRNGRIAAIGPQGSVNTQGARRIDGRGRYLIPGLADMHVHFMNGNQAINQDLLALYLANGVTTVLNLNGHPSHLELAKRIESGDLLGPRLFSSGPTLRGNPPSSYEEGAAAVIRQKAQGYHFIKVYNQIPEPAYRGIIDQARKLGIEVIGHAVRSVNIEGALRSGQHVAHMEEFIYGYFRQGISSAELPQDPESARRRLSGMLDSSRIPVLAAQTAESGIYVVPNLVAYHYILRQVEDLDQVLDRPEVRLVYSAFQSFWGPASNRYTTRPNLPRFQAVLEVSFPFLQELTHAFQQAGVPLLMGSDALIPGVVPGYSAHEDLQELVAAGLSNYQALLAATRRPAEFLGRMDVSGTVEAGKWADLVLLEGNPLQDISNTRRIAAVMSRGRWLDRQHLDGLLQPIP